MDWISAVNEGSLLRLSIRPGSSKDEVIGLHGDRLKIKLAARPVDGAANEGLIEFLAKILSLPKSKINLIRGEKSKQKDVWVGIKPAEIKKGPLGALWNNVTS